MEPKPGGALVSIEWGYDLHEIVVSPRNWSRFRGSTRSGLGRVAIASAALIGSTGASKVALNALGHSHLCTMWHSRISKLPSLRIFRLVFAYSISSEAKCPKSRQVH